MSPSYSTFTDTLVSSGGVNVEFVPEDNDFCCQTMSPSYSTFTDTLVSSVGVNVEFVPEDNDLI